MRTMNTLVLFFTEGMAPTTEERETAMGLFAKVGFRVASMAEGALEKCDAVAGNPPENYKKAYPFVKSAAELDEALANAGTGKRPKKRGSAKDEGSEGAADGWTPNAT